MRRIAAIGVLVAGVIAAVVVLASNSGHGGDPYQVRAIFDDAAFTVSGEDVRIAGAPVGSITKLEVTDRSGRGSAKSCNTASGGCKAAVILEIDKAGFTPFHADAFCSIRPQSLIGEKYVDCNPGTASAPPLERIPNGHPGAGTYLLPVTHSHSPVDTDIVNNIYRQPTREQFSIILNELGTGLAARGSDLNEVIHRANPALGYTDQVLKILAAQNRQLAKLATDSDQVLTPLALAKREIADFIKQANITSVASASRANDIAASFRLLPPFLRQLRPLMKDLGSLADQGTPLFNSVSDSAAAQSQQFRELAPFAGVARRSLIALGNAAVQQQPALIATIPLAKRLLKLGNAGVPSFNALDRLTSSLDRTGGIEQLMAVLFYGTTVANPFDSAGHFIRTEALIGSCTGYAKTPVGGCSANFTQSGKAAAASASPAAASAPPTVASAHAAVASAAPAPARAPLEGLLHYLIGSGR